MSADKCPVCGCIEMYPWSATQDYPSQIGLECGYEVMGEGCKHSERLAIERGSEVERLTAKLAKWESELSKVMPPDFKDWWQNSRDEWPELARWVIQAGRAQQSSAWEHVEKLTARVEDLEYKLSLAECMIMGINNMWSACDNTDEHRKACANKAVEYINEIKLKKPA